METSEQINELAAALSKLQSSISNPAKDAQAHHSKYASFPMILNTIRPHLEKNGLAIIQTSHKAERYGHVCVIVTTRIVHSSGQFIEEEISTAINSQAKNTVQEMGSLISYMKRYAIQGMVLIAGDEDDDGEAAARVAQQDSNKIKAALITDEEKQSIESKAKQKGIAISVILQSFDLNSLDQMDKIQWNSAMSKLSKRADKEI